MSTTNTPTTDQSLDQRQTTTTNNDTQPNRTQPLSPKIRSPGTETETEDEEAFLSFDEQEQDDTTTSNTTISAIMSQGGSILSRMMPGYNKTHQDENVNVGIAGTPPRVPLPPGTAASTLSKAFRVHDVEIDDDEQGDDSQDEDDEEEEEVQVDVNAAVDVDPNSTWPAPGGYPKNSSTARIVSPAEVPDFFTRPSIRIVGGFAARVPESEQGDDDDRDDGDEIDDASLTARASSRRHSAENGNGNERRGSPVGSPRSMSGHGGEHDASPILGYGVVRRQKQPGRLLSLDVFRGMVIIGMMIVNFQIPGKALFMLAHAEWFGLTLADLIFPSFLFIVGVTIPHCPTRGMLNPPECTAQSRLDLLILGGTGHTYQHLPYDPEGILSTLTAVVSGTMGVIVGVSLLRGLMPDRSDGRWKDRAREGMFGAGVLAALIGGVGVAGFGRVPVSKPLWTPSFMLVSAGVAMGAFGFVFWRVDNQASENVGAPTAMTERGGGNGGIERGSPPRRVGLGVDDASTRLLEEGRARQHYGAVEGSGMDSSHVAASGVSSASVTPTGTHQPRHNRGAGNFTVTKTPCR
ncbi:hypothetical protein HDU76_003279 [Blyttiomyces sp. JEL0837]|nr:hypothetical protein HDU76_003279 [Blyttiomyces sp. JEL0837]